MTSNKKSKNQLDKEKTDRRTDSKHRDNTERMNIGVTVDRALWRELKALAVRKGVLTGVLLDKAIDEYLQRNET